MLVCAAIGWIERRQTQIVLVSVGIINEMLRKVELLLLNFFVLSWQFYRVFRCRFADQLLRAPRTPIFSGTPSKNIVAR